jgi:RNA polymerase sigma factor (sigma-70 family)
MRNGQLDNALRHVRNLVAAGQTHDLLDRELLERFVTRHDEAAFAAIVERHGPLVLGVCRRTLRGEHHAEDACQATFLVLARKAGTIRKRDALGSWLYGVAGRVARKLRADVQRRAAQEVTAADVPRPDTTGEITWREGLVVLDEELSRLPATYRSALVLCYLEGRTQDEAARELGCSPGALRGRLERARERLRTRLVRRGVGLPAALLGTALASTQAANAVPPTLAVGTVKAAALVATGQALPGVVPPNVATLTEGVLKAMFVTRIKTVLILALTVSLLGAGVLAGAAQGQRAVAAANEASPSAPIAADGEAAEPGREAKAGMPPNDQRPEEKGAVEEHTARGVVRDAAGKPIADARVYWLAFAQPRLMPLVMPRGQQQDPALAILAEGRTDPQGSIELRARYAPRAYALMQLLVAAPGYGLAGQQFTEGQGVVAVILRPEIPIRGQLLTPAGAPAKGVRVRMQSITSGRENSIGVGPRPQDKVPSYWPAPVLTDDQGRFTLGGVPEGASAHLTVTHNDFAQEELYVFAKSEASDAQKSFDVRALKPDFKHTLSPARPVQGVVTAADTGKPMPGVVVEVIPWGPHGGMPFEGRTDAQGRYRVSGHAATSNFLGYWIAAYPPADSGYIPVTTQHDQPWPAGAKFLEKNLTLPRGRLLRGSVLDGDTNQPVAGASIVYQPKQGNPHARGNYELRNRVLTDKDGHFTITGLAGEGYLVAEGPSPDFRRVTLSGDATARGMDLFPHGFAKVDVPEKGEPVPATVRLRKGVTLEARVVRPDGSPVPWILAGCRQLNAVQIDRWPNSQRFDKGQFRMTGADPDETYRVFFVQPELHLGAFADLKYDGKPAEVRLEPTASVRGKLVNQDGTPPRNYQAYALLLTTREEGKLGPFDWFGNDRLVIYTNVTHDFGRQQTSPDGSFVVDNLIPGARMYLVGAGGGQLVVRKPVTLKPGEVKDLGTLTLAKEGQQ